MEYNQLIECLNKKGVLSQLKSKRMTTSEMPSLLYLRLIIAGIATQKSRTNCMMTALHTYVNRNEEKHIGECGIQAKMEGMELEQWLCEAIAKQLGGE